jgi:predicted transcriptional regulator
MVDPETSNALARLLSSDIKLELLQLFHSNPKLTYSVEDIAKQIGRTIDELEPELNDLLELGVIKKIGNLGPICLDEEKDREIQAQISRHLTESGSRH